MQQNRLFQVYRCSQIPGVAMHHRADAQAPVVRLVPSHEFPAVVAEKVAPGKPPVEGEREVADCSFIRDKGACGNRVKGAPVRGDDDRHVLRRLHPALDF